MIELLLAAAMIVYYFGTQSITIQAAFKRLKFNVTLKRLFQWQNKAKDNDEFQRYRTRIYESVRKNSSADSDGFAELYVNFHLFSFIITSSALHCTIFLSH